MMPRATLLFASLFVLSLLDGEVVAECPSEHDIPVMYDANLYLGAYYYVNGNAETTIQACTGDPNIYPEAYDYTPDIPDTSLFNHALVIRPGCIVYEFSEDEYQGSVTEFAAGVHPNVLSLHERSSFKVRCYIEHINCQPSDGYTMVLLCDAIGAVVDSECAYTKTIGTSYTQSISESMQLDTALEEHMKESFFGLFEVEIGVSVTTGYDWTQVSQSTQSETESFQVTAVAPAGSVLTIEQALGQCGGSQVNTELFRIIQTEGDGQSTVRYVKAVKDDLPLV